MKGKQQKRKRILALALTICMVFSLFSEFHVTAKAAGSDSSYPIIVQTKGNGTAAANLDETSEGTTVNLTATPNAGYELKEWQVINGAATIADAHSNTTTFVMPNEAVTVKAIFEKKNSITVQAGTNGSASSNLTQALEGREVEVTATPDAGYQFKEWQVINGGVNFTDVHSNPATFTMPNEDVTVKAIFEENPKYTITVNSEGNGAAAANMFHALPGTSITLNAVPDEGYRLKEWQVVSGDVEIEAVHEAHTRFIMSKGDVTIKAIFEKIPHYVQIRTEGFGTAKTDKNNATAGETVTLTAVPREGYKLKEWLVISGGVNVTKTTNNPNSATFIMSGEDVTIKAIFEAISYRVIVRVDESCQEGGIVSTGTTVTESGTATVGQKVGISAVPNDEWRLKEWKVIKGGNITISPGADAENASFTMPAADVEIKAVFERRPYDVHVDIKDSSKGMGSVHADVTHAPKGEEVVLIANAYPGYHFIGWTVLAGNHLELKQEADKHEGNFCFTMPGQEDIPEGGIKIVAEFKAIPYESITVKTQPKFEYVEGQELDLTSMVITLTEFGKEPKDVSYDQFDQMGIEVSMANGSPLTAADHDGTKIRFTTKDGKIAESEPLKIEERCPEAIEVTSPPKLEYIEGQQLSLDNLKVTVKYNYTPENVEPDTISYKDFKGRGITVYLADKGDLDNGIKLDNGIVLGIGHNEKVIVVRYTNYKSYTKIIELGPEEVGSLTVIKKIPTRIVVKTQPKLSYIESPLEIGKLDLSGMAVTVTYDDKTQEDITYADFAKKRITANPAHGTHLTVAAHNGKGVTVICEDASSVKADTNSLTVAAKEIAKLEVKTQPTKLDYVAGQKLDLAGLVAHVTYNDGEEKDIAYADFAANHITASPANETVLTVADQNQKAVKLTGGKGSVDTVKLTVVKKAVTTIEVTKQPKLDYAQGQLLDLSNLEVSVTYNDGEQKTWIVNIYLDNFFKVSKAIFFRCQIA